MARISRQAPAASPGPRRSPRLLFAMMALAAAVILCLGGLAALVLRDSPRAAAGLALSSAFGGPFTLIDQDGRTVTEAALKGKWALIYFGYTHCPDACPTALNDMALARDALGAQADRLRLVFVSVDPERDTPEALKSYVGAFDAPILGLTGSPAQVAQAAKAYRVYYAKHPKADGDYDMDHSSIIYVMDPEGRFAASFTHETTPEQMTERLKRLLS